MPELVEIEIYRRSLEAVVGLAVEAVETPDDWFLKGSTTAGALRDSLVDRAVSGVRRIGKLALVDFEEATVGLRFGMTGRIEVGGRQPIGRLLYSTSSSDERYVRFGLRFERDVSVSIIDPRRLGGVELGPDETRLGPDAATISSESLALAMRGKRAVKGVLLDQSRIAGVGNLICDETLWRCGLDPRRGADDLDSDEIEVLASGLRSTISLLLERGGSHMGDLQEERTRDGVCPVDGAALRRDSIGGRTTYWCPHHQA